MLDYNVQEQKFLIDLSNGAKMFLYYIQWDMDTQAVLSAVGESNCAIHRAVWFLQN